MCSALAALAACAAACSDPQGGTDVGNGATVELDLSAYEQPPGPGSQSVDLSSGARVDAIWMAVDRVRLRPGAECLEDDTEVDLEGPLVADLAGAGLVGGPASFAVQAGPFCRLRVGFHKLEAAVPAGAPAELAGLSILVLGTRSDGVAFQVRSEINEETELDATNGSFELPAGTSPLFLAHDVGPWIGALALDSLAGSPVVVDKESNADRLAAFEEAVKLSARLFRDQDADGDLSSGEHASGQELAK